MSYIPNYLGDLHCHTKRSDGHDEPWELLDKAGELGMKIIAITDHDVTPERKSSRDGHELDLLKYAHQLGIDLLLGMEISCDTDVEDVHILAFGCDWDNPFFSDLNEFTCKSKVEGYRELVRILGDHQLGISWAEVMADGIAPDRIQKKRIFELMARRGYAPNWQEAKLMVKTNPAFNIKRAKPDPVEVIDNICHAGGISILAHPYLIAETVDGPRQTLTRDQYIEKLIDRGLNGIEVCYTYDKTSYNGNKSREELYHEAVGKYQGRLQILSGGSDYHADHKKGVSNARCIGECGITPEYFYHNDLLKRLSIISGPKRFVG
ncbi:MAG: PHP domain-containing protein [Bacillota bacterium]